MDENNASAANSQARQQDQPSELQPEPELEPELEPQLEPQPESQLEPQLESQLEPQLESQLESQLKSQLEPQLKSQLEPQLESQLEPQLEPSSDLQKPVTSENHDFGSAFASGRDDDDPKPGPSTSNPDDSTIPQTIFYVKEFKTLLKENQQIILQSVNGPCPLIAIVNCLLLQQRLTLPASIEYITAASICSLLGNYLLDKAALGKQEENHTEQYILDCLERFVEIQTGIDVNVKFDRVDGFEYTPELSLFDLAHVRLVHGWVIDPQDSVLATLVGDLTYNQLVEKTMTLSSSSDTREVSEALMLKDHLESSQLTVHGICELNSHLQSGDITVLFRNNHFSTITKHNDRLYVLVTDIGWFEERLIIWETLDSTCNSSSFVDGVFECASVSTSRSKSSDHDEEYALSLGLQVSEEEQLEQQRLWQEAKLNNVQQQQGKAEETRSQTNQHSKERKKAASTCSVM